VTQEAVTRKEASRDRLTCDPNARVQRSDTGREQRHSAGHGFHRLVQVRYAVRATSSTRAGSHWGMRLQILEFISAPFQLRGPTVSAVALSFRIGIPLPLWE
jgi:hypothetical protein